MQSSNLNKTRKHLEAIYREYHHPSFIGMDPLVCVNRYRDADPQTLETAGLVAASISYGRVEQIIKSVNDIFDRTGTDLHSFEQTPFNDKRTAMAGFNHRFNNGTDIALLFECIGIAHKKHRTLETLFVKGFSTGHATVREALVLFVEHLRRYAAGVNGPLKKSFLYLLPSPESASACKRLNMFLRWMVRTDDGIDFGIWKNIPASHLLMPVDTHVARTTRRLGLTARTTADWKMAEEITAEIKKISTHDPVKYDFSLCRAGMAALRKQN